MSEMTKLSPIEFAATPAKLWTPRIPADQLWTNELSSFDGYLPAEEIVDLSAEFLDRDYWQPDYKVGSYSRSAQNQKLIDIAVALRGRGDHDASMIDSELAISLERTNKTFDLYEGIEAPDFDGSFAFVVPTRIDSQVSEYGDEILPYLTLLRHVDNFTRQRLLAGTCPWVLDIYQPDSNGRQGAMIFAPVFKDIQTDVKDPIEALATTSDIISDTITFARDRLGIEVAGLGATLPLLTYMAKKYLGKELAVDGVTTTTGHGGTVWLINETIRQARNELTLPDSNTVSVIGTGGIGKSAADYILSSDPDSLVQLYDIKPQKLQSVAEELRAKYGTNRVQASDNIRTLLNNKGIIVSAVTSPIALNGPGNDNLDLRDSFIVDDSQPHGVDRTEVEALGGHVGWVIGKDGTTTRSLTFVNGFSYGGWGPAKGNEVWGCQAEAGVVFLGDAKEAAINEAVTPESAHRIGQLCTDLGIAAAPLQSFGRYI